MTKRIRWVRVALAGIIVLALGISGCGRRGSLEIPPPKDQKEDSADNKNLTQSFSPMAPSVTPHASF